MEENKDLYYEKKAQYHDDVLGIYEQAIAQNAKYYRAVSSSGKYFGWDNNKPLPAEDGQEWFINPKYIEPAVEPEQAGDSVMQGEVADLEDKPVLEGENKPVAGETVAYDNLPESDKTIKIADNDDAARAEKPYPELVADLQTRIFELERELMAAEEMRVITERELDEVKDAIKTLIGFIKSA